MSLQQEISLSHNRGLVGTELDVLMEGPCGDGTGSLKGRFYGQAPEVDGIVTVTDGEGRPGDIVAVRITDALAYDLVGTIKQ